MLIFKSSQSIHGERLQRVLDTLDNSYNNVLEFRLPGWRNEVVYKELGKQKISFCGMSHPPDEVVQNTSNIYYRFHGTPHLYKSPYDITFLENVVTQIKTNKKIKHAFLYFNNDIDGSAIENARELQEIVTGPLEVK